MSGFAGTKAAGYPCRTLQRLKRNSAGGIKVLLLALFLTGAASAQDSGVRGLRPGRFGLGLRTTFNVFPDDGFFGVGSGGQWRLGASKHVNTEWFYDYMHSQNSRNAWRTDHHIGWSVQISPFKRGFTGNVPRPYLLAGQCFDLTRVAISGYASRGSVYDSPRMPFVFSGAAQAGAGVSWWVHDNVELNLQVQYMIHLGKDVHVDYSPLAADLPPVVETDNRTDASGHVLSQLSMSYYFLNFRRAK